jgi:hypothetical protein
MIRLSSMRIYLITALVLGCAFAAASVAAETRPAQAAVSHPTGANEVVLRVSSGGGFVPVQVNLRAMPSFTLYGDGTVIVPGPVIQIYPGPAVSPLVRSKLGERQVQALLVRARRAGLLAPRTIDYGDMGTIGIADAPTTTLVVNAAGRHIERQAYALGITAQGGRISPAQAKARQALARFIARLPQGVSGARYSPHAIAAYVGPFRGQGQPGARRIVWPLGSNLATAGKRVSSGLEYRCILVGGDSVKRLSATLRKANELSRWIARPGATVAYMVVARPLLPDERRCP